MRSKNLNLKTLSPYLSFPGLALLLIFLSTSSPRAAQGDGEWGLQSVHHTLSLPLLPPQREDSSHSSPAPALGPTHGRQSSPNCSSMGPSHGLQFFTNFSSMGPFHRVQPFRNRLLLLGSPTGSEALPENLLQHGLLSPWVHRSRQEPPSAWAPHGVTASFRCVHLLWCGVLHGLQVDICSTVDLHRLQWDSLTHHGLFHELQGSSAQAPEAPPTRPSPLTWVSAELLLSCSITALSHCNRCLTGFSPFLTTLSQRCYRHR